MKLVHRLLAIWTGVVLLFFYLPIAVLVLFSFNQSKLNIVWTGFTLEWYTKLWRDTVLVRALQNSLIVAVVTTAISLVLGTAGGWLLHRYRYRGRAALETGAFLPMIVPEVILGVSLLLLFVAIGLELGYTTIIVSHVTFCFPFVMAAVQARLAGLDPALEEAALDLGATPVQAFVKVIVPYLVPALVSGGLMAFTLSLDELIVTWFTASAGTRTLPLEIFGRIKKGLDPSLNAISTVFLVVTVLALAIVEMVRRRSAAPARRAATRSIAALALFLGAPGAALAEELNLFAWSEYVPQVVLDGFTEETGIRVNSESYASNEEMLAKLLSGAARYDLIQPSEYVVEALRKEQLLVPLDHAKLPHLGNIGKEYWGRPHDPELAYSVPYMQGTVGIVVDTEKVKEPIRGYGDVFQPKYAGRIVVLDDALEIVTWVLAAQGLGSDAVTRENLEQVRPLLAKWLPLVRVYDSDSPKTALLNGDVDLGVVWSGEAAILIREQPGRFAYVLPREGSHMFIDSLAIPKGARNVDAAHRFIDYVLRPEVSRKLSAEFPYTNPNVEARKLLTPAERANPASYPPGEAKLATLRDIGPLAADVDKLFTDLKAQSGR